MVLDPFPGPPAQSRGHSFSDKQKKKGVLTPAVRDGEGVSTVGGGVTPAPAQQRSASCQEGARETKNKRQEREPGGEPAGGAEGCAIETRCWMQTCETKRE